MLCWISVSKWSSSTERRIVRVRVSQRVASQHAIQSVNAPGKTCCDPWNRVYQPALWTFLFHWRWKERRFGEILSTPITAAVNNWSVFYILFLPFVRSCNYFVHVIRESEENAWKADVTPLTQPTAIHSKWAEPNIKARKRTGALQGLLLDWYCE